MGTMRFGLRSKSVENVNDVKTSLITSRRIIFTPDVDLKDELKNTAVQITCYDRDGNEVKRVTSTDDAEVEDENSLTPDPSPTGEGSGNQGGGNTGGNTGGGTSPGSITTGGDNGSGDNGGGDNGGGSNNGPGDFEEG